ncbi:hypothetical protein [Geomonas agri]|uniref:hypothetical protein n=1 Tax=Geomonas agri TaxID=2873702 RepID=UPI001CD3F604|nr:hypothetical protein [Geomonas agri]
MAEIFFIASDERALDLIESLRIQSPKSLTFETDLPSAIGRLPKEQPHYVFIQSSLDEIPAEEIAAQTRALVTAPDLQLILLADGEAPPAPAGFAASFSLSLPTPRLSSEVMQLLTAEVVVAAQAKPPADFSDLSDFGKLPDLFTLDNQADFEIADFDDTAFEPHLAPLWPDQAEKDTATGKGAAAPSAPANDRQNGFIEEIGFFVSDPQPPARRLPEAEPAPYVPAAPAPRAVEVAPPPPPLDGLAQTMSPPPGSQQPAQVAPAAPAHHEPPTKSAQRTPKSLYPTPDQIYRKPPELCGQELEEDGAAPLSQPHGSGSSKSVTKGIAVLGVLVLALVVVVWQRSKPEPAPSALRSLTPAATAPAPAAPTATAQAAGSFPGFVPKVPADAAYAAAHPGWELYRGDHKEFRIYREQGKVRAIQVLPEGKNDLNEGTLGRYFKEATGADLPPDGETRAQNGIAVETRKAQNGAEIAIYRTSDPHIVGIVLQLPDKGHK